VQVKTNVKLSLFFPDQSTNIPYSVSLNATKDVL
jgi:hypothetical protein